MSLRPARARRPRLALAVSALALAIVAAPSADVAAGPPDAATPVGPSVGAASNALKPATGATGATAAKPAPAAATAPKPKRAKASRASSPSTAWTKDPAGHASAKQWVFDVAVDRGVVLVEKARAVTLARPTSTARVAGRFALELWIGHELLDRVRFSPPLMGDEVERRKARLFAKPTFDKITVKTKAQLADHDRATYVVLVDGQKNERTKFWWPPEADGTLQPMTVPAGAESVKPDAKPPAAPAAPAAKP